MNIVSGRIAREQGHEDETGMGRYKFSCGDTLR